MAVNILKDAIQMHQSSGGIFHMYNQALPQLYPVYILSSLLTAFIKSKNDRIELK